MSYERRMLEQLAMPPRREVQKLLLRTLLKHGGTIREFGAREQIVEEMADEFRLNTTQRSAFLETIYRKQNRPKKAILWHRLLFRAADSLAQQKLISRPAETLQITNRREWMLTEQGFDEALRLCNIPSARKDSLTVKSYEVQIVVKKLTEAKKPLDYDPMDRTKKVRIITSKAALRDRAFRHAVIEVYGHKCSVCGLKIHSPDALTWEVEAAHIVPHHLLGRDDIWNGIALCRFHHWAFDVGWFTFLDDFRIQVSPQLDQVPSDFARMRGDEPIRPLPNQRLLLPRQIEYHPHHAAVRWHRENIFWQQPGTST